MNSPNRPIGTNTTKLCTSQVEENCLPPFEFYSFLVVILLILAAPVYFLWKIFTSKRSDEIVDDFDALLEAEQQDLEQYEDGATLLMRLESGNGFREHDALEITTYLGAEGISANFHSVGRFELEGLTTWAIYVRPQDEEKARELMEKYEGKK